MSKRDEEDRLESLENDLPGGATDAPKEKLKGERRRPKGVFVRLTNKEWDQLCADAALVHWSKPRVLRAAYLSNSPIVLLMDRQSMERFEAEHKRIGVNINQLSAKANSSELVPYDALMSLKEQHQALYRFVSRFHGGR